MLSPKRTKYRKPHRGNRKGKALRGNKISFGDFALQALEPGWITSRQIEAGRRAMSRYAKRGGKLWIRMFPDRSITARAAEIIGLPFFKKPKKMRNLECVLYVTVFKLKINFI